MDNTLAYRISRTPEHRRDDRHDVQRASSWPRPRASASASASRPLLPPPPYLNSLKIPLSPWLHCHPQAVWCPEVRRPPSWLFGFSYGSSGKHIRLTDTRSADNQFPFPLTACAQYLDRISESDLARIIFDHRRTPIVSFRSDTQRVVSRISQTLVAKWGQNMNQVEADTMWFITGIRGVRSHVPRIRRAFRDPLTKKYVIIMDYIDGSDLVDIWPRVGPRRRNRIGQQVSWIVQQMQTIHARCPGPVGMHRCRTLMYKDYSVPACMDAYMWNEHINALINEVNRQMTTKPFKFLPLKFYNHVLTNMHLDPTSFVFDRNGHIWIMGWERGGFYPLECELGMLEYLIPRHSIFGIVTRTVAQHVPYEPAVLSACAAVAALVNNDLEQVDRLHEISRM